jgi:DNA-binding NarL/FixJ family response regulator
MPTSKSSGPPATEQHPPHSGLRPPTLGTSPGRAPPPLFEREAELAVIRAHVLGAREGTGGIVAIEGRAGMGKTRLLAEGRAAAVAAGLEVLAARGGEREDEFAYGVVRQLFEPLLMTAADDLRAELLSGAAGLAAPLFDESQLAAALEGGADTSFATLHGLYWLAANLALRQPTLLAIDDLHWADAPSLRWLVHLARRLEGLPLLVLAALRPPEQSQRADLLTELVTDPASVLVRPGALGLPSVAAFARATFEAEPHERFCASCHEATGGNPLFIEALLDTLATEGVAPTAEASTRVHEVGPEPVARAVALRLSHLPAEATLLARAVAILGDGAEPAQAAALAGLDREVAASAATQLARSDIIQAQPRLEFVHPVVRAAVHAEIGPAERAADHRRAAALLTDAGAEPERVAAHLLLVPPGGDDFVIPILREAAARSVGRGAADAAVAYLRRALEEPPADDVRPELLAQLGMTERLVDTQAAAGHLGEALRQTDDASRHAELAIEYGRALWYSGRNREAIEVFQEAIGRLGPDQRELRQLLEAEAIGSGWWEAELYPVAQKLLAKVGAEDLEGGPVSDVLLATLAHYETRRGSDRERAVALAERSVASGSLERESAVAIFYAAFAFTLAGRTEEAAGVFDRAVAESRRRGDIFSVGGLLGFRGLLATERGNLISAAEDLREAVEIMQVRGALMNLQYYAAFLADLQLERGEVEEAQAALARTGLAEDLPPSAHFSFFLDTRGKVRLERGRTLEALADFTEVGRILEALEIHNPAWRPWRSHAALALHALGRDDEGYALAAEELELARRWGAPRSIGVALRALGLVQGGREGEAHLREAVPVLAGSSARIERARALVDLGAALRRGKKRSEARELLREGLELAHRLGANALVERARAELRATGARPRRLVVTGLESLTPSEHRIAEMAAEGMPNKDIAQSLFVTVKTVEVHLSSVYRKLGIASRTQLATVIPASTLA